MCEVGVNTVNKTELTSCRVEVLDKVKAESSAAAHV